MLNDKTYTKTPTKPIVPSFIGYLTFLFVVILIFIEIWLFIHKFYWILGIPIILYFVLDKISTIFWAWYKYQTFKIKNTNKGNYLEIKYCDIVSTNASWSKIYKIYSISKIKNTIDGVIVYTNNALYRMPPLKFKKIKKIKLFDVDEKMLEMLKEFMI